MNGIFYLIRTLTCTLALLALAVNSSHSRMLYGYHIPEEHLHQAALNHVDSLFSGQAGILSPTYIVAIEQPRIYHDQTASFFILLALVAAIAIFRQSNPIYFRNLFRAFRNPTLSARQLREPLEQNNIANLALDLFFSVSLGFYLFFALKYSFHPQSFSPYTRPVLIGVFIIAIIIIYLLRFFFLRFTGWAFGIQDIMSHYAFNIMLINKIMGIILLPFTFILAFGQGTWVQASLFISLIIITVLIINRYIRSGPAFRYFLTFSKLHFFLYLCASEILPLALLIKLSTQWIIKA